MANPRGQAGVITALLAPIIVGAAALGIDAALWQGNQRSLQGAADQAAIAGVNAFILAGNTDSVGADIGARKAALAVAETFGYPACSTADAGCPCTSGYGACADAATTTTALQCVNAPANCLQVQITEQETRYLSAVVFSTDPIASAKATVTVGAGGACVLALDQKATGGSVPAQPPSVHLGGSSIMTLTACNLVNNLNDPGATKDESTITGTSILQATQGGKILLAQTDQYFGTGRVSPNPIYGTSPAPDPYANRTPPSPTSCTYTKYGDNGNNSNPQTINTTKTLSPGTYCGGLNINGNAVVTMLPGTYIMDGGGFNAQGGAVITGLGVTIYVTCDSFATSGTPPAQTNCTGTNYGSV
ncbi:MAG TPA: pilus assembly protein TadG-related protein, partial [Candidatus Dormibacteraeota bacterium]|nr:pilus assembly protein TadG-related protein [Candidatus Dormibacteraeota bacterium]